MSENIYETKPKKMGMAASAWDAYVAFREEMTDAEAQEQIKTIHQAHVRKLIAADMLRGDGALIVTDIPDFDLSLVDAHFPSLNTRECTLFSKRGATLVIDILTRKRGIPPLRN